MSRKNPAVVKLALGALHSCSLNIIGEVHCWGYNLFNQIDVPKVREFNRDGRMNVDHNNTHTQTHTDTDTHTHKNDKDYLEISDISTG